LASLRPRAQEFSNHGNRPQKLSATPSELAGIAYEVEARRRDEAAGII